MHFDPTKAGEGDVHKFSFLVQILTSSHMPLSGSTDPWARFWEAQQVIGCIGGKKIHLQSFSFSEPLLQKNKFPPSFTGKINFYLTLFMINTVLGSLLFPNFCSQSLIPQTQNSWNLLYLYHMVWILSYDEVQKKYLWAHTPCLFPYHYAISKITYVFLQGTVFNKRMLLPGTYQVVRLNYIQLQKLLGHCLSKNLSVNHGLEV